jgi:hypothetical protein
MAPTSSVRLTVADALVAALRAKPVLSGVQVEYGWPGDRIERECIWLGPITGTLQLPLMKAGRMYRDDDWTQQVLVDVMMPAATELREATERVEQLGAVLEGVLADDPTVGVIGITYGSVESKDQAGPVWTQGEGPWVQLVYELGFRARLT